MTGIRIGCCGFAGRRETYFRRYPVLEVEQTFYDPPRVMTAEKWRREAPALFEFTVKAWQLITHEPSSPTYRHMQTRLSPEVLAGAGNFQPTEAVWLGWQRTQEIAAALRARTILLQCPATFAPTPEHKANLQQFIQRVREEARRTQREFRLVWDPGGDWPDPEVAALCQELDLTHGVDPYVRMPVTSDCCYFRLHGIKGYRHRHTDDELKQLLPILEQFNHGYCLFNNLTMREDASRLNWLRRAAKQTIPEPQPACC